MILEPLKQGMQKSEMIECLKRMKEDFIGKPKARTKGMEKYTK